MHGSDVSPKIFLLHNCLSWASPTLKPKSFMSLLTHCNHVFLPLPLPTFPTTSTRIGNTVNNSGCLFLIYLLFRRLFFLNLLVHRSSPASTECVPAPPVKGHYLPEC